MIEHGTAAVTCLLSGLETFSENPLPHTKILSVVTGLHGFHLYASEHWTEYLLVDAASRNYSTSISSVYEMAIQLAKQLEEFDMSSSLDDEEHGFNSVDSRLELLQYQPQLQRHVGAAMRARSQKRFESQAFLDTGKSPYNPYELLLK
jgi:hypothetical protein